MSYTILRLNSLASCGMYSSILQSVGGIYGLKKIDRYLGFAYLALASSLKHNRSLKFMDKLNKTIDWDRVDQILMSHDTVGISGEGDGHGPRYCCSSA